MFDSAPTPMGPRSHKEDDFMPSQDRRSPPPPALDATARAHIGEQLKEFYSSILTEPMPTRFQQLLDELEQKERAAGAAEGGKGPAP